MPRKSPYTITLTAHKKNTLESAARKYTSPYRDVIRGKIILMAAQGYSNDEIAFSLNTPRQIVRLCVSNMNTGEKVHGLI